MSQVEKPLSELISSIDQVDGVTPSEQDGSEIQPEKKKSKGFLIVVSILLFLILGMGGYYVYKQYFAQEDPSTEENLDVETNTEVVEEENVKLLTEVIVPSESGGEDKVIQLNMPNGWTVNKSIDYASVITNGSFSIYIIKDPIITGGGWGFMYDGEESYETYVSPLEINGVSVNKVTHVLPKDIIKETDLEHVFGGSVFASQDSNISTPTLELNKEQYLIKYVYEDEQVISVDSQVYSEEVIVMDNIIKSIVIK